MSFQTIIMTQADDKEEQWNKLIPSFRFGVAACSVGVLTFYVLTIPLQTSGLMPVHISLVDLIVMPAALVMGLIGSLFASCLWLRDRFWMLYFPIAVLSLSVMLALTWQRLN